MRFPQQHRTVRGREAIQLFAQLGVIGLPIGLQAVRALGVRQHGVVLVERVAAERLGRAQAGLGLAGVQAFVIGRAVQVHHIARIPRTDHRRAQRLRELVQRVQVPVGIAGLQAQRRHLRALRVGDLAAQMGNGDQQRGGAAAEMIDVAQGKTPGNKDGALQGAAAGDGRLYARQHGPSR
ncbi:hypothetical protein G6F24_015057 [Rhizopus arrhizus]|nr:hypothetical protein G6F24_015057 [Rhizopus arrhizus]